MEAENGCYAKIFRILQFSIKIWIEPSYGRKYAPNRLKF